MAITDSESRSLGTGSHVPKSDVNSNLVWQQGSRAPLGPIVAPGIQLATETGPGRGRPISTAAILVIGALGLDWLAQVLQWNSVGLVELRTYGTTTYSTPIGDSRLPTYMSYLALAIFVWAGVVNAFQSRRLQVSALIPVALGIIFMCGTFWLLVGYEPTEWRFALGTDGPLTLVMCMGVYAGLDRTLWPVLRPLALVIAYSAAALGLYYALRLSVNGVIVGTTPMNQHMPTAFWFAFYPVLVGGSSGWKSQFAALIPIALCVPTAIMIASRSWTLLLAMALALGLKRALQPNARLISVKTLAPGLLVLALLGAGTWGLTIALPDQMEVFTGRFKEDTRSSQYSQFFEQVPVFSLITGLGPKATYNFSDKGDYSYIDNQFLFILFRYGLPMLFGYCAVVLWPGWRLLINGGEHPERLLGVYFVFWTLAMLGLSIYHGILNNPQNFLAILLAGRCLALMTLHKWETEFPPGRGLPVLRGE